jgi:hypothetical protein
MVVKRNATEARQGESGRRVFTVLAVSILIAIALAVAAYLYVSTTANEEIAEEPVVPGAAPDGGAQQP